ncbi:aminoglycoside 3'-phosphotransferase [Tenggerimyces flavus]|uniref:Phosphotransferase n=1 Tax=Tenggerimyces flavus TaxID=1708749 RepID=A0ABV7Y9G0_9ACTN|nr:aminoglycoside 3'-phosphotransferase [Tenggerimyces flavus]MBM7788810.1 kanamycin kinase [Tenggerimyces flavus]
MNETTGSGFVDPSTPVPEAVQTLGAGDPVTTLWINGEGGMTFRVGATRFAKWVPAGSGLDLVAEAERMRWASRYAKVPRVLESGADASGAWLVTSALLGESAITERWKADPATAVRVAGAALREFHEAFPVEECPYDWSVVARLERAHVEHGPGDPPPIDRLVVCHGDACVPNTLIDEHGNYAGHVDLGDLGVADRWADLAVGSWSTEWNYGPGWEDAYLESYGVEADAERIRYYRALWNLA